MNDDSNHTERPALKAPAAELKEMLEHSAKKERQRRNWGAALSALAVCGLAILGWEMSRYAVKIKHAADRIGVLEDKERELDRAIAVKKEELDHLRKERKQLQVASTWEVARLEKQNKQLSAAAPIESVVTPHVTFQKLSRPSDSYEFRVWLEVPEDRQKEIESAVYEFGTEGRATERSSNADDGYCVRREFSKCVSKVQLTLRFENGRTSRQHFDMCDLSGWRRGYVRLATNPAPEGPIFMAQELAHQGFEAKVMLTDGEGPYQVVLGPFPEDKVQNALNGWLVTGESGLPTSGKHFIEQVYPPQDTCASTGSSDGDEGNAPSDSEAGPGSTKQGSLKQGSTQGSSERFAAGTDAPAPLPPPPPPAWDEHSPRQEPSTKSDRGSSVIKRRLPGKLLSPDSIPF